MTSDNGSAPGLVSGLMFGLMFGISGIGAAGLGQFADIYGIVWVYKFCAYLPLLGLATILLPDANRPRQDLGACAVGRVGSG